MPFWINWQSGGDFILANREMTKNSYGNTRPDSGKADIRPVLKRYRGRCRRRNEPVTKLRCQDCSCGNGGELPCSHPNCIQKTCLLETISP